MDKDLDKLRDKVYSNTYEMHMDLVKWLYFNHRKILREWEKTKGNFRICFAGSSKEERKGK